MSASFPRPVSRGGRFPFVLLVAVLGSSCAAPYAVRAPSPDEIPALEARNEASPDDPGTLTLLGAAYREDGRLEDAARTLNRALTVAPSSPDATFFLGLTYEDMERFEDARQMYQRYLRLSPTGALAERVEDRVEYLERQEMQIAIREAVAREREIADTPPDPTTVAVFPFPYEGESEDLRPLGMALSGMLATDLALSSRLTVLERAQLQALLSEIARGQAGIVDQSTAARGGRILGAGRIVRGEVGGTEDDLALDATVIEISPDSEDASSVEGSDALERFFDLQKQLVLDLFDAMGVTLTAAERELVTQRRTENLQALLAYGRGIEASYQGEEAAAARFFTQAAQLDPGFAEASQEAQESESVSQAQGTATSDLVQAAVDEAVEALELEQEIVEAVEQAADYNPQRDAAPISEESPVTSTGVRVIIRRPSGGGQ
jgi:tetratricopeptide (TPR) repeat protein